MATLENEATSRPLQMADSAGSPPPALQNLNAGVLVLEAASQHAGHACTSACALLAQLREANEHLVIAALCDQTLRDDAEASCRHQIELLAVLAHELRNPLAPISMASTMLGRIEDPSLQLTSLQKIISRQVGHLARMLDDALDAVRVSTGKFTMLLQPVLIADLVQQGIDMVRGRLEQRRQSLSIEVPGIGLVVDGDPMRLVQVFSNLLVNASKFTQDGGSIMVSIAAIGDQVVVKVQDNGVGIADHDITQVFALFSQGPRSLERTDSGLGVGLSVARDIVQQHFGTLEACSGGPGLGSTFSVTLPIAGKQPQA